MNALHTMANDEEKEHHDTQPLAMQSWCFEILYNDVGGDSGGSAHSLVDFGIILIMLIALLVCGINS